MIHAVGFGRKNHDRHVVTAFQRRQLQPDSFIDAAAETIALDGGFEDFFANYHREATVLAARVFEIFERNERRANRPPVFIEKPQTAVAVKSMFLLQHTYYQLYHNKNPPSSRLRGNFRAILNRKFCSSL